MALNPCVKRFILVVLCGNPIVKGNFVTFANGLILTLDVEIATLTVYANQLNFLNQAVSLQINAVQSIANKIKSDLNVVLQPLLLAKECKDLKDILQRAQNNRATRALKSFQKFVYEKSRLLDMTTYINSIIAQQRALRDTLLEIVQEIPNICG